MVCISSDSSVDFITPPVKRSLFEPSLQQHRQLQTQAIAHPCPVCDICGNVSKMGMQRDAVILTLVVCFAGNHLMNELFTYTLDKLPGHSSFTVACHRVKMQPRLLSHVEIETVEAGTPTSALCTLRMRWIWWCSPLQQLT